jgi:uncharacterized protein
MFREIRRGKQLLSMEDTIEVMKRCTNGVLACLGDEGYPYAVPLSYISISTVKSIFIQQKLVTKLTLLRRTQRYRFQ